MLLSTFFLLLLPLVLAILGITILQGSVEAKAYATSWPVAWLMRVEESGLSMPRISVPTP